MPNWCYNHLEVTGDEKQLHEFVEKSVSIHEESDHCFSFEGTLPRGDRKDWHEWSIANWGTKWDACKPHIDHDDKDYFAVTFQSAWAPPIQWVANIMKDFPDLSFQLEYDEEGMGFGGKLEAQHDMIWDSRMYEIGYASDCCEYQVYNIDDEEYSLKEEDIKTKYGTDYQCSKCKEECETISMNEAEIKTNIKEIKNNEN